MNIIQSDTEANLQLHLYKSILVMSTNLRKLWSSSFGLDVDDSEMSMEILSLEFSAES